MEVHRQRCQSCGSRDMRNVLVRQPNEPQTVFVRCVECGELVARYRLRDYFHVGKGLESFLRSNAMGGGDSGRVWFERFERTQQEVVDDFARVLEELERVDKDDVPGSLGEVAGGTASGPHAGDSAATQDEGEPSGEGEPAADAAP